MTAYSQDQNKSKDGPYMFVSYVSPDRNKVEATLKALYQRGFRYWYDRFLELGDDWEKDIMGNIDESSAFLAFISHDFGTRRVAREEIRRALEKRDASLEVKKKKPDFPEYKVVLVLLDSGALTAFEDDDGEKIRDKIRKTQYIRYWKEGGITGGLTEDIIRRLTGANWPESIIDQKRRSANGFKEPWKPGVIPEDELQDLLDEANKLPWRSHHRLIDNYTPRKEVVDSEELRFYPLSDAQMEPTAVYPIIMDNQWVPREVYDSPKLISEFHQYGFTSPEISDIIIDKQRREIIRALLHNWQIIVNRASVFNSKVFSDWYQPGNSEYDAFRDMMGDDSIVVYLFGEPRPTDKPAFDVNPDIFQNWQDFCINAPAKKEISCLRLDWDSKESNQYEIDKLLGYAFQNFCLITAQDQYRINALMAALDIGSGRRGAFTKLWREIQQEAIEWNANTGKAYTRNQFYKDFLVQSGSKVEQCLLDTNKEFVDELKQIIDFVYAMNLPDALNLTPAIPPDSPMAAFRYSERSQIQGQREISAEELAFAAEEFTRSVKAAMKEEPSAEEAPSAKSKKSRRYCKADMPFPVRTDFTLGQLYDIRDSKEWRHYVRKLTDGKTRARLKEMDFHNIPNVWESYWEFLNWMRGNGKFLDREWKTVPAALSVRYHFEETELAAVYDRKEDGTPRLRMYFPDLEELTRRESLQRKTAFWIDYVCGDVIADYRMDNLLLTEIRLFEGMTRVNGIDVFKKLRCALCESGFERVPIPDSV